MPLTIGQIVHNRYRIDALLGQGGMGAVYRAYDLTLNRSCAIKEMVPPPQLSPGEVAQMCQQFQQEASTLANLSHPGLTRVTDRFTWGGCEILVMDFVEGQSLETLIEQARGRGLEEAQVLTWTRQLLAALDYCHNQGIVHRDLKPANIIITPQGQAVLVDFGLVKVWNPANPQTMTVLRGMGTPAYAPPEQYGLGAGHTDACSDIYSLGATLYHALTGQEPPMATLRMASPVSFLLPRSLNPAMSPGTEAVIIKAMELEKQRRFQSARAMLAALNQPTSRSTPAPGPTTTRSLPLPLLAMGTLALLLLCAGALWLGGQGSGRPPATPTLDIASRWTATPERTASPFPPSVTAEPSTLAPSPTWTPLPPSPTLVPVPPSSTLTPAPALPSRAEQQQALLDGVRWREGNGDPVFAPYTTSPPHLDGYLDEWTSSQYTIIYNVSQPKNWSGTADCSGWFYIAWDNDNLYLGIEVFDDWHVQEDKGRTLYKGDDVEIQIDTSLQGDYTSAEWSNDDGQIGLTVHDFAGNYEAFIWKPTEQALALPMVARQTAGGYALEAAVPWWSLNLNPQAETPYGFCLNLGDDDSPGSKGQESMVSNTATRKWENPTTWGTLILVDW